MGKVKKYQGNLTKLGVLISQKSKANNNNKTFNEKNNYII